MFLFNCFFAFQSEKLSNKSIRKEEMSYIFWGVGWLYLDVAKDEQRTDKKIPNESELYQT